MAEIMQGNSVGIPRRLFNPNTLTAYRRDRLIMESSLDKLYKVIDVETAKVFMAKIVSKKLSMQLDAPAVMDEIAIHRGLNHRNVVAFYGNFQDRRNIYIILGLCQHGSLKCMLQHRKTITEFECRFFISQIIHGVRYLHGKDIVHRDLNLSSMLLNAQLAVKISGFWMAMHMERSGDRKKPLCARPTFPAPEILNETAHSFPVDIWAIGCVMYELLVGQSPFAAKRPKDVIAKIKNCDFQTAGCLRRPSTAMVRAILQWNPNLRPTIGELKRFDFVRNHPVPRSLPSAWLTTSPSVSDVRSLEAEIQERRPLREEDGDLQARYYPITMSASVCCPNENFRSDMKSLYEQLSSLIKSKPELLRSSMGEDNTDPASQPLYWISKWVDDSRKQCFAYQLSDKSIGVMFKDSTKIILLPNHVDVHFINRVGGKSYMTRNVFPKTLRKKIEVLSHFLKSFMSNFLAKAVANPIKFTAKGEDNGAKRSLMPHLNFWFRTACATVVHLTNGSVQINFVSSFAYGNILLCPHKAAVTCMDQGGNFQTYRFASIIAHGCSRDLFRKLLLAHDYVARMLQKMYF